MDPESTVRRLDLARGDDRRVLIVRRLEVDAESPARSRSRLEDLRRRAVRPARGPVDPHAEAVEFADETEALRCLSQDIARGVAAGRWWWAGRVPAGTPGDALAAVWCRSARWVPPALAALLREDPHEAVAVAALLTPAQAVAVVAAVAAAYSAPVTGQEPAVPPGETGRAALPSVGDAPAAYAASAPAEDPVPSQPPAVTALLSLVRLLDERPAQAHLPAVRDWMTQAVALSSHRPRPADRLSPWVPPSVPARPSAAGPQPAPPAGAPGHSHRDDAVTPLTRGHDADPEQSQRPWRHTPWAGSGTSMPTELATMLYAINLVHRFRLHEVAVHHEEAATGWALVEAVVRWLLLQVPLPGRRTLLADPLLHLLADLDGRPPEVRTPVRLGHATRPVRTFLGEAGIGVETFCQPGTVLVSRTHVDVILRLEQIDLAARTVGLDQDPGWVPDLGRVVLFHFEGDG
jgi:hypothetical protein